MQEQAVSVGEHLSLGADGKLELDLPLDLLGLYSQEYGRYSYAVIDDRDTVLFSSLKDHTALFPDDSRSAAIEFMNTLVPTDWRLTAPAPLAILLRALLLRVGSARAPRRPAAS